MYNKPDGWYSGIVSIWGLPINEVYVDIESEIKLAIFNALKTLFKNKHIMAKNLNVNVDAIKNFFYRNHTASLSFIEKIIELLLVNGIEEFNLRTVEENIKSIQTKTGKKVYNIKFPMDFNSENGAILVSMIFHDGGIEKNKLWPFYRSYDNEKIEQMKSVFQRFAGKSNLYVGKNGTLVQFPNIFGLILVYGLGMAPGPKVENNPNIPEFLFNANKNVQAAFLKQAFDDEGTISLDKHSIKEVKMVLSTDVSNLSESLRHSIRKGKLLMYAPNILKGDLKLLRKIGIMVNSPRVADEYSTKRLKVRHLWEISISSRKNIMNFYQKVGFSLSRKQSVLEHYLNGKVYPALP